MSKIIDFVPRRKDPSFSPEEHCFDAVVNALQEMPRAGRLCAIAAVCDDDDMKQLAQLAAYYLGFAVLDEIKKALDQAYPEREPQP